MIFTKLLLIAFALCCLTTVYAGKLPKTKINSNTTEVAPSKSEVSTAETVVETDDKSSEEDVDDDDDDDKNDVANKNALKPADDTSLSVWGIVRGVWNWIKDDFSESLFGEDSTTSTSAVREGRTFGKIRRMQMALIPIIFKFGILTAMVAFLVVLGLKTLFVVKMLFLLNALALLGKFFTLKTNFGHSEHYAAPQSSWSGWQPAPMEYGASHPSKEIHLHIHGAQGQPQVSGYTTYGNGQSGWVERRNDPYNAYDTYQSQPQNEAQNELLTNAGGVQQQVNTNYASNHRMI